MELATAEIVENTICTDVTMDEANDMINKGYEMIELCKEKNGVGLAGPQVGIFKNIIVKRNMEDPNYEIIFNPSFYRDGGMVQTIEGCLTYKDKFYHLKRFKRIGVIYYIWNGEKFLKKTKKVRGMESFVWQHEIDHIKGFTIAMKGELVEEDKINKRIGKDGKEMEVPTL